MTKLNEITEIAKEVSFQAKAENNMDASLVTLNDVIIEIDVELDMRYSNWNSNVKSMWQSLVICEIAKVDPELHAVLFPPIFMDKNGNYTRNPAKWV